LWAPAKTLTPNARPANAPRQDRHSCCLFQIDPLRLIEPNSVSNSRPASARAHRIPWLVHASSTPPAASPAGWRKSLNLGYRMDIKENVLENRRRFQSALVASDLKLISLKQILPTSSTFRRRTLRTLPRRSSATNRPLLRRIQTATASLFSSSIRQSVPSPPFMPDCAAPFTHRCEGRRETANGICTKPGDLFAASAPPSACCCYEVGTEVASSYQSQFAFAEMVLEFRTRRTQSIQWLNMMPPGHHTSHEVLLDLRKANKKNPPSFLVLASSPQHLVSSL